VSRSNGESWMKKLALALALPSYRDVRVYLVHEKGSVVAYLLVPRGALGGDVQPPLVVHGDVDDVLGQTGQVGGDEELALLLEHVARERELRGEGTHGVGVAEHGVGERGDVCGSGESRESIPGKAGRGVHAAAGNAQGFDRR